MYNVNGKIDRKKISECSTDISNDDTRNLITDELTDVQKRIIEIITSNIGGKMVNSSSLNMDFTKIGLDSITFIKTVVDLECEFDFEFDDEMLLITKFPKVESMVEYIESKI